MDFSFFLGRRRKKARYVCVEPCFDGFGAVGRKGIGKGARNRRGGQLGIGGQTDGRTDGFPKNIYIIENGGRRGDGKMLVSRRHRRHLEVSVDEIRSEQSELSNKNQK